MPEKAPDDYGDDDDEVLAKKNKDRKTKKKKEAFPIDLKVQQNKRQVSELNLRRIIFEVQHQCLMKKKM